MQSFAFRWIQVAVVYFIIALCWGIVMSATMSFDLKTIHVHVNLLGWVSMTLFGVVYHLWPKLSEGLVPKVQFWLHQIGTPVMLIALTFYLRGNKALEPVIALGSLLVLISALLFAFRVLFGKK